MKCSFALRDFVGKGKQVIQSADQKRLHDFHVYFLGREMLMGLTAKKTGGKFTFTDYRGWTNEERWEIINGEVCAMTPSPSLRHQEIVSNFHIRLKTDPQNGCYTAISPTDVVLDDFNVVHPICLSSATKIN